MSIYCSHRFFTFHLNALLLPRECFRLDSSFNTVLLEQWDENRPLRMAPNSSVVDDSTGILNHLNILRSGKNFENFQNDSLLIPISNTSSMFPLVRTVTVEDHFEFSTVSRIAPMFEANGPIEIADSDDDGDVAVQQPIETTFGAIGSTPPLAMINANESVDGDPDGPIMDIENDIPLLGFDPIDDGNQSQLENDVAAAVAAPSEDDHQLQPSGTMKMRPKRNAVKRLACSCCGSSHEKMPKDDKKSETIPAQLALQENVDVKPIADQNILGKLFECTHCDLKFTKFAYLSTHRTKFHSNGMRNKRWFNCVRCMKCFANEKDKTWHEMGCENRRYECYLCKVYVSTDKIRMQNHVRTHSGAKPFPCPVCGKYFRSRTYLVRHIAFHDRKKM